MGYIYAMSNKSMTEGKYSLYEFKRITMETAQEEYKLLLFNRYLIRINL